MKHSVAIKLALFLLALLANRQDNFCQETRPGDYSAFENNIQAFKDTLHDIAQRTENEFFRMHCESILSVINFENSLTAYEADLLEKMYQAFIDRFDTDSPAEFDSYLERRRPLILAWESPSDGSVSFSWLKLPREWDPAKKYPLYVELHGLWSVASFAIQYLTYPFLQEPSYNKAFEDGYLLSPWGRGNYWYLGNSETDIWECIAALDTIADIDVSRKYLCGHSMGGFGAMNIASKSPGVWAALGIYAGALNYSPGLVNQTVANALKDVPVYFVCGTEDGLYNVNEDAYILLGNTGNKNLFFTSFTGGHVYREGDVFVMYMWMRKFINDDVITDLDVINGSPGGRLKIISCTNPVQSELRIMYNSANSDLLKVKIYDLSGRTIRTICDEGRENFISFSVSGLQAGPYLLQLQSGNLFSDTMLFVKK